MSYPIRPLESVVEVAAGGGAPQRANAFGDTGTPFIRAGSLPALVNGASESTLEHITEDVAKEHRLRKFPSNTVVFAKSGMSATKGHVYRLRGDAYVVNHLAALVPGEQVSPEYLEHSLRVFSPVELIQDAAYPSIRLSEVGGMTIPLPPIPEQKRIATILDKADNIRRRRREAMALNEEFLRSLFLEMFGDPVTNPKEFPTGTIRDLVDSTTYGTSEKAHPDTGAYPVLRMNNITYAGGWDFSSLKYVDLPVSSLDRYLVHKGQLLFNRTNSKELVGKTAVYRQNEPMAYAGYLVRAIPKPEADAEYISAYLNSRHGKAVLLGMCKSIVGMANINAQEFLSIPILLPPGPLQRAFGEIVRTLEQKKQTLHQASEQSENLFRSLQQLAFSAALK